jgi:hypothetical protein
MSGSSAPKETPIVRNVEPPTFGATDLAIRGGAVVVKVGDTAENIDRAFPQPANAATFTELPSQFNGLYRARGFENATLGFGAIYYDNQVACAIHRIENITVGEVNQIVEQYTRAQGDPAEKIQGASIAYWFWKEGSQIQMICSAPDRTQNQRFDLTIGLGDKVVMEALRMTPLQAGNDMRNAEKTRAQASATNKPN